ncbi:hypothetical protein GGR57DRAFT_454477 [Xylariaceae sp. FL1272]|nr:hypothetical protein GGR57DRAFT_454477 [Xylariaceae sp. FL1272]
MSTTTPTGATTTAAGRTIWNDKTRSDLLQAIVEIAPPSSEEWTRILQLLRQQGYSYNQNAALQHLQKLKRKDGNAAGNGSGTNSAQATPQKGRKNGKKTSAVSTPKSGRGGKRKAEDVLDDDDEDVKTDAKKPKTDIEAAGHVKQEVVGDHDVDDDYV